MMDITLFRQILSYDAFYYSCWAIVFLIMVLWLFFPRRKESDRNVSFVQLLVGLALCIICWSVKVLPIIKDLNANSYIEIHASYERAKHQSNSLPAAVHITFGDEEMTLYLPHKDRNKNVGDEDHYISYSEELFPIGEYEGTIWYSENSHYILKFMPDP